MFLLPKINNLFGFPLFWHWAYLMKFTTVLVMFVCCLPSFDLRILITPLVSSNYSYNIYS